MTPIFPEENGEVVLRGIQVLWFALFNQGIMLVTVCLLSWWDSRRKRKDAITLTTSTGQLDGKYVKVD